MGDIVATTSNKTVIDSVYMNELPTAYEVPKPAKKVFTDYDLFVADKFTFGSKIGALTNRSTNAYALLPNVVERCGEHSDEANLLVSRLKECCVEQSKQIDMAKIGRKVKCMPSIWTKRNKITNDDTQEELRTKELLNNCLLDRRPYFFKHRYEESKKEYDKYKKSRDALCFAKFNMSVDSLRANPEKTEEQINWLKGYDEYSPLVESNSVMNLLCRYIEEADFQIKSRIKCGDEFNPLVYINNNVGYWEEYYTDIVKCYDRHLRDYVKMSIGSGDLFVEERAVEKLRENMRFICSNPIIVVNCLVKYLMIKNPKKNKDILWMAYGKQLTANAMANNPDAVTFPFPSEDGDIHYLGTAYKLEEVKPYQID